MARLGHQTNPQIAQSNATHRVKLSIKKKKSYPLQRGRSITCGQVYETSSVIWMTLSAFQRSTRDSFSGNLCSRPFANIAGWVVLSRGSWCLESGSSLCVKSANLKTISSNACRNVQYCRNGKVKQSKTRYDGVPASQRKYFSHARSDKVPRFCMNLVAFCFISVDNDNRNMW